jgi:hypothetical protein
MGYLGAFSPLIIIWAISRSNLKMPSGRRTVPVRAKGEILQEGYIGENGQINQPVYDMIKVRVEAPAMRFVYKTEWVSKNGHRMRYAVLKHTGFDDGRRTYDVGDKQKNSNVFPTYQDAYYACEWNEFNNDSINPYGSTGIKGWVLRNNRYPLTLEGQKEYVDMLFDNASTPEPEPQPSEPEPLPPEVLPPSGLNPMLPPMGGLTPIQATEVDEEPVMIDEVVEEEPIDVVEEVVEEEPVAEINIEALQSRLNKQRGLGSNNYGGFRV